MNMIRRYRLFYIIIIGLTLIQISCGETREKDCDEIVLSEMVIEKNGIYYEGDCEIHAKDL